VKRLAAPRAWAVPRKEHTFVEKPLPGPHPASSCLPLAYVLRYSLGYAQNAREVRRILSAGQVLVDGAVRREPAFPVGLMDVVELVAAGEAYRILVEEGGVLVPVRIGEAEKGFKLCRVQGRTSVRGGYAYALHDGRTIRVQPGEEPLRRGYTVKLGLPKGEVLGVAPLKEGVLAGAMAGRNAGRWGRLEAFTLAVFPQEASGRIAPFMGEPYTVPVRYIFVVGDAEPWIKLPGVLGG